MSASQFVAKARVTELPILELDPATEQPCGWRRRRAEAQETLLHLMLEQAPQMDAQTRAQREAWLAGDAEKIAQLADFPLKNEAARALQTKIASEKRAMLAEKLAAALPGKKQAFVVLNADDLAGAKGIVALLQAKGFKLEQLAGFPWEIVCEIARWVVCCC